MRPALSLDATAAVVGKASETWRKQWRAYVRNMGFPAPLPGRHRYWRPEEVEAWLARRDKALNLGGKAHDPAPANDAFHRSPNCHPLRGVSPARLHRERAELAALMTKGH
jgi:hypothetical protein